MSKVYFVRQPRYMGFIEHVRYWTIREIEVGSQDDNELSSGWTTNSAGEAVQLSATYTRFETLEEAEAYIASAWAEAD